MLKSFFHTGFVVKDLERAVDFYVNMLLYAQDPDGNRLDFVETFRCY